MTGPAGGSGCERRDVRRRAGFLSAVVLFAAVPVGAVPAARPLGMAEAYTAVAEGPEGVLYNPAGLRLSKGLEFVTGYGQPFTGPAGVDIRETQGGALYSHPGWGASAVHWSQSDVSTYYMERTLLLSYAHGFTWAGGRYLFGVSSRQRRFEYDLDARVQNDPVFARGNGKTVASMDAGVLYARRTLSGLRLGAAVQDLDEPDVGLAQSLLLPRTVRAGLSYGFARKGWAFRPSVEGTWQAGRRSQAAALEATAPGDRWTLRGGLRRSGKKADGVSLGMTYTLPLGEGPWALSLDYAFVHPVAIQDTIGSHFAGLRIRR